MSKKLSKDVFSVVVTYEPDLKTLKNVLLSLVEQVKSTVVIDNGSSIRGLCGLVDTFKGKVQLIRLNRNHGIAKAHNEGILIARRQGASFVLLMDQDSIPENDMVAKLAQAVSAIPKIGSVGPRYVDRRQNNPPPFIRIEGIRLKREKCEDENALVPVDYLISSGCLIPMSVLDAVGPMREELFIDYVDIEWGLRAKSCGFQNYGVCNAKMSHSLGSDPLLFLGRRIPLHNPVRHYYHFRNAIWLYKQPWVPKNWKIVDGWRLLRKYVFYSLFTHRRLEHLRMMTLGLIHGFKGRMGPLTNA